MDTFIYGMIAGSFVTLFYMALLKSGSDADDLMLGDDQYHED